MNQYRPPSADDSIESTFNQLETEALVQSVVSAKARKRNNENLIFSETSFKTALTRLGADSCALALMLSHGRILSGKISLVGNDFLSISNGNLGDTLVSLSAIHSISVNDLIGHKGEDQEFATRNVSLASFLSDNIAKGTKLKIVTPNNPNGHFANLAEVGKDFLTASHSAKNETHLIPLYSILELSVVNHLG